MHDLAIALSGRLLVHLFAERRPAAAKPVAAAIGSFMNPVRARGAEGRARYLHRLRALDGSVPTCRQLPVLGLGVFDEFLELYEVSGGGSVVQFYMDKYYERQTELEAVPGFMLVDDVRETQSES